MTTLAKLSASQQADITRQILSHAASLELPPWRTILLNSDETGLTVTVDLRSSHAWFAGADMKVTQHGSVKTASATIDVGGHSVRLLCTWATCEVDGCKCKDAAEVSG